MVHSERRLVAQTEQNFGGLELFCEFEREPISALIGIFNHKLLICISTLPPQERTYSNMSGRDFNVVVHQFLATTHSTVHTRAVSENYPFDFSAEIVTDPISQYWKERRIFSRSWEFWADNRDDNREAGIPIAALTHSLSLEEAGRRIRDMFESYLQKGFFMVTSPNRRIRRCFRFVDGQWQEVDWDTERKKVKNRPRRK